jgi:hypothetical protein
VIALPKMMTFQMSMVDVNGILSGLEQSSTTTEIETKQADNNIDNETTKSKRGGERKKKEVDKKKLIKADTDLAETLGSLLYLFGIFGYFGFFDLLYLCEFRNPFSLMLN